MNIERIKQLAEQHGLITAQRIVVREKVRAAIHRAQTVDEIKAILLDMYPEVKP
jgi:hypothetical protein